MVTLVEGAVVAESLAISPPAVVTGMARKSTAPPVAVAQVY
jgi:hypothetical protein